MKRILLVLMVGFIVPTGLNAQKVYKVDNGDGTSKVILDMTAATGMPEGAVTNVSKTDIYYKAQNIQNDTWLFSDCNGIVYPDYATMNLASGWLNEKVYQKLEIMKGDPFEPVNLADAWDYCKTLSEGGGGNWRLPTQRELVMISIFKVALENCIGDGSLSHGFFSATEGSITYAHTVVPHDSNQGESRPLGIRKSMVGARAYVRCVREIK